jgi:hypothetical protein
MPGLFYFLLILSVYRRRVFKTNMRKDTTSLYWRTFDESESVLLRFLRKLESANENFPDGGFVGLFVNRHGFSCLWDQRSQNWH